MNLNLNMNNTIPDNDKSNIRLYILDPLTVIIKLAILSNKPIGTKLLIKDNVIYLQEPGIFQSITRYYYSSNKSDLQYMYNPINIACQTYLSKDNIIRNKRIKQLFICAENGLKKLIETYKNCSIISLCLNYYYTIIDNYVEETYNDKIFHKDSMTPYYTTELLESCFKLWTDEKIKIILDLITFLNNDTSDAYENVKSLENIINNVDKNIQSIIN